MDEEDEAFKQKHEDQEKVELKVMALGRAPWPKVKLRNLAK